MKCIVCNSKSLFFLSKSYNKKPFDLFMKDIGEIKYFKCSNCGFTQSKTHAELSKSQWEKLNFDFHHYLEGNSFIDEQRINQPPYLQQAIMLNVLAKNDIIGSDSMIDFAGGYGTLSDILFKYFDINLAVYDPYVQNNKRDIYVPKYKLGKFKVVFCSALFEHLTTRVAFDEINNCVADDGCLILHTVICENVPADEDWFYFAPPVHCAFHTNKSMQILMEQWNFKCSIYCLPSKSWILFKTEPEMLQNKVEIINRSLQYDYLIYKKGFVDYWKGF